MLGPRDEIVIEVTDGDETQQKLLAEMVADMLNDHNENHTCNARGRRDRAKHFLLLVRENRISDNQTMETLSLAIEEAGVEFARAEIGELTGGVPF